MSVMCVTYENSSDNATIASLYVYKCRVNMNIVISNSLPAIS